MYSTEKEIINGCLNRKRKAQKALFEKYHAPLMGICMRYSRSRSEAEDVLMMGFTRIFKKISLYSGKGSFEGWMKKIVVHIAIDNFRKNNKYYFHDQYEDLHRELDYAEYIPDNLSLNDIMKTIQELPPGYRMVFNLFAIEGYSHKEIAEMLNISESTSKTQLLKARKKLQDQLAGAYFPSSVTKEKNHFNHLKLINPLIEINGKQ